MQLVAAATLKKASQLAIRIGLVAGIPLIAAGNIADVALLRGFGIGTVIVSTLALGTVLVATSRTAALKIAGFSMLAAMSVALVYAVGQFTHVAILDVSRMAMTHGLLNALGFTLFGLVGHLRRACPVKRRPVA